MYCTNQDVESYYLGKEFKCGDYLESSEISTFIDQDSAYMDSIIAKKYSLPVTNTNDLLILKQINEKLVVGTVDDIFRERLEDSKFDRGRNYRKEAMKMLDKIEKGEIILNTSEGESAIKFNNIDSEGNTVEKRFKDSNIEPIVTSRDREKHTVVKYS